MKKHFMAMTTWSRLVRGDDIADPKAGKEKLGSLEHDEGDKENNTIDFLLMGKRDKKAAKCFLTKPLKLTVG